jgi:rhodanese-related sulfurtransferase
MKSVNTSVKILLLALLFVNATACKGKSAQTSDIEIGIEPFISTYEKDSKLQILDVRTPEEFSSGHVPRAVPLPLNDLTSGSAVIPFEKTSEIYVICRSGNRSKTAVQYLKDQGYTNVKSVSGGTMAWSSLNKHLDK